MIRAAWCRWWHAGAYVRPSPAGGWRCERCRTAFVGLSAAGVLKLDGDDIQLTGYWRALLEAQVRNEPVPTFVATTLLITATKTGKVLRQVQLGRTA